MRTEFLKLTAVVTLLSLLYASQGLPSRVREDAALLHRAERSMLWRWITLRPVGASCWDPAECVTKYCKEHLCSFKD